VAQLRITAMEEAMIDNLEVEVLALAKRDHGTLQNPK
jgi:hypothetical protein